MAALASTEARVVLGAAVADDVAGLVILAIVVGAVSKRGVAVASLAGTIGTALGFLVAATVLGVWLVPRLIRVLGRSARIEGSVMILALVVALGLGGLASSVSLAPVVGAFVAGVAVGESMRRGEIQRRLQPIGQLLIPVFFLQIGLDTKVRSFADPRALRIAAALAAVAVVGKIVAGLGVKRGSADRLLVGIAMIPRGEVGLIFASLGLAQGVLDARAHSVLVVVVMVSTVVSPTLIRWRIKRIHRVAGTATGAQEPDGGWLVVSRDEVELAAEPPVSMAPALGLDAAVAVATRRPGPLLLKWLSEIPPGADPSWDDGLRERLFRLLREGDVRSWRLLEVTGLLGRILPDIDEAVRRRAHETLDLDPGGSLRWETLEGLSTLAADVRDPAALVLDRLARADLVRLGALARDAFGAEDDPAAKAGRLGTLIGLAETDTSFLRLLVGERGLLAAAARRIDVSEDSVLELAAHLNDPGAADALYVLAVAEDAMEPMDRARLDEIHRLIRTVLDHPDVTGLAGGDVLEQRRLDAQRALQGALPAHAIREHLEDAPARYLLAQSPEAISRHIRMVETRPAGFEVRMHAEPAGAGGEWTVHMAFLDRRGALAAVAGALSSCRVAVNEAFVSTWRSGVAIDVFKVSAASDVDWDAVRETVTGRLARPDSNGGPPSVDGTVEIDNLASPWFTIVEVRARDRTGLLYRVASALALAGSDIHSAHVTTHDGVAVDTFSVTHNGAKLDAAAERALRLVFAGKPPTRWRASWRKLARVGRG